MEKGLDPILGFELRANREKVRPAVDQNIWWFSLLVLVFSLFAFFFIELYLCNHIPDLLAPPCTEPRAQLSECSFFVFVAF